MSRAATYYSASAAFLLVAFVSLLILTAGPAPACAPAAPSGKAVVNADQTVIILWDPASKTEHFIRRASFKSDANDFGFLIPTPSQPILDESSNEAFTNLAKLTAPEIKKEHAPPASMGCSCSKPLTAEAMPALTILEEKDVAGFHAVVLQTNSSAMLIDWLKQNDFNYSKAFEAWAKPYVEGGWKITALKVAKASDKRDDKSVMAQALRLSFKTDRPLFPYREPVAGVAAQLLGATNRLLRIYFISDARYQGELEKPPAWTGQTAWANRLSDADRTSTLALLKLPETTGPAKCWLTEFEDPWPRDVATGDLYFSPSPTQQTVKRDPIIVYVSATSHDLTPVVLGIVAIAPAFVGRRRRRRNRRPPPNVGAKVPSDSTV